MSKAGLMRTHARRGKQNGARARAQLSKASDGKSSAHQSGGEPELDIWSAGNLAARAMDTPRSFSAPQQAGLLLRMQRTVGNAAIAQRLAQQQVQLQREEREAAQEAPAPTAVHQPAITKGPQGVPAFWHNAGMGQRVLWHPGIAINANVIVDVFKEGGRLMVGWFDFSRARHEVRPLDLFENWLSTGPGGQWQFRHGRAYQWLTEKVAPGEWYANRRDPVGFVAKKLDELKPAREEEKRTVEDVLAPAAYRALVKREALSNLAKSQEATRNLLSKGTKFFSAIAKPWGPLQQRKAALEAEQARVRSAMIAQEPEAAPAGGVPKSTTQSSAQPELNRIARELWTIEKTMAGMEKEQPLFQVMRKHGLPITAKSIQDTLHKIDENIEKTRAAIIENKLDPMELQGLRRRVSRKRSRFKTTLRGERPAAEAYEKEKWQRQLGLFLFDIMIMVLSGGFSTVLAALQTAGAYEQATVREAATLTSPSGPSISSREEANAAWWEAHLSAAGAVLQGLSWAAEVRGLLLPRTFSAQKRLRLRQFKQEASVLQRRVGEAFAEVETLQTRLRRIRQATGAAGRMAAGERAGALAVLKNTERATKRLLADLRSQFGRANQHAHKLQKELQHLEAVQPARYREMQRQLDEQLEALIGKWSDIEIKLDLLSKDVSLVPSEGKQD